MKQPKRTGSESTYGSPVLDPQTAYYQQTQPPTQKSRFLTPKTFRSAINDRLDNPLVSLFRLASRVVQLVFAVTAGISYAIDLFKPVENSAFIYAEVVFGLTLITLIIDAFTIREYKLTWAIEWIICLLWFVVFAVFFQIYFATAIEPRYAGANIRTMKGIVWVDLINALLWMGSVSFSTTMCCSGLRAKIRGKREQWRLRRERKKRSGNLNVMSEMEQGIVRAPPQLQSQPLYHQERLPTYEEGSLENRQ
jgi:hypothetical protein